MTPADSTTIDQTSSTTILPSTTTIDQFTSAAISSATPYADHTTAVEVITSSTDLITAGEATTSSVILATAEASTMSTIDSATSDVLSTTTLTTMTVDASSTMIIDSTPFEIESSTHAVDTTTLAATTLFGLIPTVIADPTTLVAPMSLTISSVDPIATFEITTVNTILDLPTSTTDGIVATSMADSSIVSADVTNTYSSEFLNVAIPTDTVDLSTPSLAQTTTAEQTIDATTTSDASATAFETTSGSDASTTEDVITTSESTIMTTENSAEVISVTTMPDAMSASNAIATAVSTTDVISARDTSVVTSMIEHSTFDLTTSIHEASTIEASAIATTVSTLNSLDDSRTGDNMMTTATATEMTFVSSSQDMLVPVVTATIDATTTINPTVLYVSSVMIPQITSNAATTTSNYGMMLPSSTGISVVSTSNQVSSSTSPEMSTIVAATLPTTNSDSTKAQAGQSNKQMVTIAAGVGGAIAGVLALLVGLGVYSRRRYQKKQREQDRADIQYDFFTNVGRRLSTFSNYNDSSRRGSVADGETGVSADEGYPRVRRGPLPQYYEARNSPNTISENGSGDVHSSGLFTPGAYTPEARSRRQSYVVGMQESDPLHKARGRRASLQDYVFMKKFSAKVADEDTSNYVGENNTPVWSRRTSLRPLAEKYDPAHRPSLTDAETLRNLKNCPVLPDIPKDS